MPADRPWAFSSSSLSTVMVAVPLAPGVGVKNNVPALFGLV
jgi:hypothetical protein